MKIYANVDLDEWLSDVEKNIKKYDDLFVELFCAYENFVLKNKKLFDSYHKNLDDDIVAEKYFDKQEKFLKSKEISLIENIFDLIKNDDIYN